MEKINSSRTASIKGLLVPSGVNSHFNQQNMNFFCYIQQVRAIIPQGRIDLQEKNANTIIEANSPFLWVPEINGQLSNKKKQTKGILLIHGLFDSPFMLRDLGRVWFEAGILVQAVLLPGHGTVPADLTKIGYQEWLKAVDYGINDLCTKVDEVYLAGFSLGSTLALYHALKYPFIKGIFLLSPVLNLQTHLLWQLRAYRNFRWFCPHLKYYRLNSQHTYIKYESLALNAAWQTAALIKLTGELLKQKQLLMPVWIAASQDDETADLKATIDFFCAHKNPRSRFILYGNHFSSVQDSRMVFRTSAFPSMKIINFSHICLPIAPSNTHLGMIGDYQDFQHYHYKLPSKKQDIYMGSVSSDNLRKYRLQRLTYNPDFELMSEFFCTAIV